ncbi:MAG: excinuclease ABC subunit C [Candidatus Methanolliviera sp. GoM_oil]|nr:MAG: excinuclease ABC subunit C [Candidatus Methanolliviera sp. GoM_oil]
MIYLPELPEDPGCYLFSNAAGEIIYIGKAKNLKKRVSSYFQGGEHDQKTEALLQRVVSVDFIITETEVEALILENTLIKKHQPKYNINLKDAKNYAFIQITDDEFPRIGIARSPHDFVVGSRKSSIFKEVQGNGTFFGPFVSAKERDYLLSVVKKTFYLRSCRRMPKRACLRYHIGSCSAPCIGKIKREEYLKDVRRAESVLRGKTDELIRALHAEMLEKSAKQEFERAMELREQIAAVEHLAERQKMKRQKRYNEDIINYVLSDRKVYLMIFNVYKGTLEGKQEFIFDEDDDFLEEFLVQYYSEHEPPSELILPKGVNDALIDFLSRRKERKVRITFPKRGDKKKLLDLVGKNVEIGFFGDRLKLKELEKALRLPEPPEIIECFDISHLSGTSMVGSMVQFRNGKPDKRNYRKFKIRTVDWIDDFAAIAEVVRRRYSRLLREGGEFPDLIIIDGGKGQLSSALEELEKLGIKIPLVAIAKREEEIYVPKVSSPLLLNKGDKASLFIQEIRDEAHRFAIAYNRLLRKKKVVS